MQALLILFGAGFTIVVCLAWGRLILGDAVRDAGARFVVGAGALSAVVFALCCLHLAYWWVFLVCGVLVARPSSRLEKNRGLTPISQRKPLILRERSCEMGCLTSVFPQPARD